MWDIYLLMNIFVFTEIKTTEFNNLESSKIVAFT